MFTDVDVSRGLYLIVTLKTGKVCNVHLLSSVHKNHKYLRRNLPRNVCNNHGASESLDWNPEC